MDKVFDLIIVGAGASGLMAGAFIDEKFKTLIIEKNSKIGRKILSTGAGKCNISNTNISEENYYTDDKEKLKKIFNTVKPKQIVDLINNELGILTIEKEDGKIYPYSQRAQSVVSAFENYIKRKGIEIKTLTIVESIEYKNNLFILKAKTLPHQYEKKDFKSKHLEFKTRKLILSCGGPSYPSIGATDIGYTFLKNFGHTVLPLEPMIVPLLIEKPQLKDLSGLRFDAKTFIDDKLIKDEILFTDYGISGPFALDLSFYISFKKINDISIDLLPDLSEDFILDFLIKQYNKGKVKASELFYPVFDIKLTNYILRLKNIKGENLKEKDIKSFIDAVKNFNLYGIKKMGFENSVSKKGGVLFSEITDSFESKKQKNLYITGELINCVGISGGYNLHFAFTSGYLSAKSIKI